MNEIIKLYLYVNVHRTEQNFIYCCCCFNCLFLVEKGVRVENVHLPSSHSTSLYFYTWLVFIVFWIWISTVFFYFILFYFILFYFIFCFICSNFVKHHHTPKWNTHSILFPFIQILYRHMFQMLFEYIFAFIILCIEKKNMSNFVSI